jgi:7-keto-8-aminopelargonate synthetase-like enzyme
MSRALREMGYNTLNSRTQIIPLLIGEDLAAFTFTQKLYENGVFCTPVVSPAVPEGCALIRTSYMASHTEAELDYAINVLDKLGREFGIIGNRDRSQELAQIAQTHFGIQATA